jgi:hypothetical protein
MTASRFVEVSDKEISEIKINSHQKKHKKTCAKILKQLFASSLVISGISINFAYQMIFRAFSLAS